MKPAYYQGQQHSGQADDALRPACTHRVPFVEHPVLQEEKIIGVARKRQAFPNLAQVFIILLGLKE
jgi:hypothetical protein